MIINESVYLNNFGMLRTLLIFYSCTAFVTGKFYRPSFDSGWLEMEADSLLTFREVVHNLGQVPLLVDVQARAVDGPNINYIFKGIGDSSRDDDIPERYGGVVYIYNDIAVKLYVPKGNNHIRYNAAAIYTGEAPYWTGVNTQFSKNVQVRVRCWTSADMPNPDFRTSGIPIHASSSDITQTFVQQQHGLRTLPKLVRVRAKMLDQFIGWYTDAQGSAQANSRQMYVYQVTGGLISAFDDNKIRAWTSSYGTFGKLFNVDDGWGGTGTHNVAARRGSLEMFAWTNLRAHEQEMSFNVGSGVTDELLEVPLNVTYPGWAQDAFVSVTVEVKDGANQGLYFDGLGAGTSFPPNKGTPCAYGGLVYGYSDSALRVWRPTTSATGAIVCIPDTFGTGRYSQAVSLVTVYIKVWLIAPLVKDEFVTPTNTCIRFRLHKEDVEYISTDVNTLDVRNVTAMSDCSQNCIRHGSCVTFSYTLDNVCTLSASTDANVTSSLTSKIWTHN